ncbi:MAG: TolC family protein [Prolixibacteraceae bacterium]
MKKSTCNRSFKNQIRLLVLSFLIFLLPAAHLFAQDSPSQLNFTQLLDSALQNNYLLDANEKNKLIKEAEIEILQTNYQPQISTSLTASFWKFLLPNKQRLLGNSLTDVYTDITFQQTLYDWGEQDIKKSAIEQEIVLNDDIRRQIRNTIIWGVSDTYFEVLKARAEVDAHRNSIQQLNAHRQYAQNLHDIGKVSGVDILKIEVQISVAEKALRKAENNITAQLVKLKRLCNLSADELPGIVDQSETFFNNWENRLLLPDSIYTEALSNHPVLLASDIKMSLEAKQKELYRLENRPELYSYGIASWAHGYLPFGNNFNYNIGVGLRFTIPYWGGSSYKTKMVQSDYRVEQIDDEKTQAITDIKKEIDLALAEIADNKDEMQNNQRIMALSEETLNNSLVIYQSGQGAIIDVLDAQSILTESTIAWQKSTLLFLQSVAKLNYLTGNDNYPF